MIVCPDCHGNARECGHNRDLELSALQRAAGPVFVFGVLLALSLAMDACVGVREPARRCEVGQ